MSQPRRRLISRAIEIAALKSPVRQEILDVLSQMGSASVADIAATLGRPADALYYHVRALERAGLMLRAGERLRGRRQEAIYSTAAPELMLRYDPSSKANARTVTDAVTSMLRLGIRDFRRAMAKGSAVMEGPGRELWALRTTGWLNGKGVSDLNRRVKELRAAASQPRAKGRLFAVTILITPLDHRGRKPQGKSRQAKRKDGI